MTELTVPSSRSAIVSGTCASSPANFQPSILYPARMFSNGQSAVDGSSADESVVPILYDMSFLCASTEDSGLTSKNE